MYSFFKSIFAAGPAFAMVGVATWRPAGVMVPPDASVFSTPERWRTIPRCGIEAASTRSASMAPLPNAYMLANGRLFVLGDVFACVNRLHSARFS